MFTSDELNILCVALDNYKQTYSESIDDLLNTQASDIAIVGVRTAAENSIKNMATLMAKLRQLQMKAHGL
jgi:hypothetical protein